MNCDVKRNWKRILVLGPICIAAMRSQIANASNNYDFVGMSTSGDSIALTGAFSGADIDNDGTLEHPNNLLELTYFNAEATLTTGGGTKITTPWHLGHLEDFKFSPSAQSGLMTGEALFQNDALINGNEIHNDSTLSLSNNGNIATNVFTADIRHTNSTNTYKGLGSGPILASEKLVNPGLKLMYAMEFGENDTPFDNGSLLGNMTIDNIDDLSDLNGRRTKIRDSETVFVDENGRSREWIFESGMTTPESSSDEVKVEFHYQCGSPDVYCWGSVGDFLDLYTGDTNSADVSRLAAFEIMQGTETMRLPIESATMIAVPYREQLLGDFNASGALDVVDIDMLGRAVRGGISSAEFDVTGDGKVDRRDRRMWIEDLYGTHFGDADLNRSFESGDFVRVFQAGEYEDAIVGNSTWAEGDWDGNGEFDSGDFVLALQSGAFESMAATVQAVPEPSSAAVTFLAFLAVGILRRHR